MLYFDCLQFYKQSTTHSHKIKSERKVCQYWWVSEEILYLDTIEKCLRYPSCYFYSIVILTILLASQLTWEHLG
jgi:hypothetical protein